MTTRDDLVSLSERLRTNTYRYGYESETEAAKRRIATDLEAVSAFEAKDAEMRSLRSAYNDMNTGFQEAVDDLAAAKDRITDLERQLAEETERCARIAKEKYHGHSTVFRTQRARNYEHAGESIASAIRRGAK